MKGVVDRLMATRYDEAASLFDGEFERESALKCAILDPKCVLGHVSLKAHGNSPSPEAWEGPCLLSGGPRR